MSSWAAILAITAVGGALLLWNTVSRTKADSEQMLRKYADMLADARQQRRKDLARAAEAAAAAEAEAADTVDEV